MLLFLFVLVYMLFYQLYNSNQTDTLNMVLDVQTQALTWQKMIKPPEVKRYFYL